MGLGEMIVQCPHCGESIAVHGLGRRALNLPVINVCDALKLHHNVLAAAKELGCSRGYIYKIVKTNGLVLENLIAGRQEGGGIPTEYISTDTK